MDRHRWSIQWARLLRSAASESDVWRYGVLLTKILDGRLQRTESQQGGHSSSFDRYHATINDAIRRRIGRWKSKREEKLFGMDAPDPVFLV
jgi:hypothetical protein